MPTTLRPGTRPDAELDVKRSRFVAVARRVADVDAAREVIDGERRAHPDARHHCWAYVLGDVPASRIAKSSDDGEPGGTAGVPMLQVLRARDVVDVVVVVSRYFGGVKLGAGGLVRAYSGAVSLVLDGARWVHRQRGDVFTLALPHADAGRVEAELRAQGVDVRDAAYGARVVLTVATTDTGRLETLVAAVTAGTGVLEPAGEVWTDVP
ncbi:YigZ family protein [Rhodococcus sp. HNM0569]|uniref:IMPACT family protein n=1 Tax=Rhodococcus sp. HNM0569 TaxID=2716340 RepID=UPI00146C6921|nr:YigZ family protein [Rhodococcus sp. HNM0569]NLU82564.1 YigZ family protein [Rhodococcus sp. HNM0569]